MRHLMRYKRCVKKLTMKIWFIISQSGSINFTKFKGPFGLFKEIKEEKISLKMTEEDQDKFKRE